MSRPGDCAPSRDQMSTIYSVTGFRSFISLVLGRARQRSFKNYSKKHSE